MSNTYLCLSKQIFDYNDYHVEPYRYEDLFKIKEWRNEQIHILRQANILSDEDQINYYNNFILPSFHQQRPKIVLFSFLFEKQLIGYGGLTNCSWDNQRCELSFLLNSERSQDHDLYEKDFSAFINLMKEVTFQVLHFHRIFTETYNLRPFHVSVLEKNGFVFEGRMHDHVVIDGKFVDSLLHGCIRNKEMLEDFR
jgi:RimJ/RimL family protein N-acetyltransferase